MSYPPLVSVEDFAEWIEVPFADVTAAQRARIARYLAIASALVRGAAGGTTWVVPDSDPAELVEDVPDEIEGLVLQAVERKWDNPTGVTRDTQGPFSKSYPDAAAMGIYLTEEEEDLAGRFRDVTQAASGLWTLETMREDVPLCEATTFVPCLDPDGALYGDPFPMDAPLNGPAWTP